MESSPASARSRPLGSITGPGLALADGLALLPFHHSVACIHLALTSTGIFPLARDIVETIKPG